MWILHQPCIMRWLLLIQLMPSAALVYATRVDADRMTSSLPQLPQPLLNLTALAAFLTAVCVPFMLLWVPQQQYKWGAITVSLTLTCLVFMSFLPLLS